MQATILCGMLLTEITVLGGQLQSKPAHLSEGFAHVERQYRGWSFFTDFVSGGHFGLR